MSIDAADSHSNKTDLSLTPVFFVDDCATAGFFCTGKGTTSGTCKLAKPAGATCVTGGKRFKTHPTLSHHMLGSWYTKYFWMFTDQCAPFGAACPGASSNCPAVPAGVSCTRRTPDNDPKSTETRAAGKLKSFVWICYMFGTED